MGRTAQHIPLLGPGLPLCSLSYSTLALSLEVNIFPHQDVDDPIRVNRLFSELWGGIHNLTRQ